MLIPSLKHFVFYIDCYISDKSHDCCLENGLFTNHIFQLHLYCCKRQKNHFFLVHIYNIFFIHFVILSFSISEYFYQVLKLALLAEKLQCRKLRQTCRQLQYHEPHWWPFSVHFWLTWKILYQAQFQFERLNEYATLLLKIIFYYPIIIQRSLQHNICDSFNHQWVLVQISQRICITSEWNKMLFFIHSPKHHVWHKVDTKFKCMNNYIYESRNIFNKCEYKADINIHDITVFIQQHFMFFIFF